jgi:hypothetical protein
MSIRGKDDRDITTGSVPRGRYKIYKRRRSARYRLVERETKGKAEISSRGVRIQANKRTSGSFRFVIDVDKEKESRLFSEINRRLKKLDR